MKEEKFLQAIKENKVPILILDPKWHRLFAIHGKTKEIKSMEKELGSLLAEQGKVGQDLKDLKKLKNTLLDNIRRNMDGANEGNSDSLQTRKLEEDSRLVDEVNQKMEACEDRLLELPHLIKEANDQLMLASMKYGYEKMKLNDQEAGEIADWIAKIREQLRENIIRKQNCEINSREIYGYMHDIFGMQILDLFDMEYGREPEEAEKDK